MHTVFGDSQNLDRGLLAEAEFLLLHNCSVKTKLTRMQIKQLTLGSEFIEAIEPGDSTELWTPQ